MVRKRVLRSLQPPVFRPPRGRKEVWLPNWHITFLRNPNLPPNMAQFLVPLKISKLDLKDYLFHAYGIPALSIRSSVKQHEPTQRYAGGPYYRPQSTKRMIVEMDTTHRGGPFAWPDEPKDFSAWDKEIFESLKKKREAFSENQLKYGTTKSRRDPNVLQKQVTEVLEGKQAWKPTWMERGLQSGQQSGVGTPWRFMKQSQKHGASRQKE